MAFLATFVAAFRRGALSFTSTATTLRSGFLEPLQTLASLHFLAASRKHPRGTDECHFLPWWQNIETKLLRPGRTKNALKCGPDPRQEMTEGSDEAGERIQEPTLTLAFFALVLNTLSSPSVVSAVLPACPCQWPPCGPASRVVLRSPKVSPQLLSALNCIAVAGLASTRRVLACHPVACPDPSPANCLNNCFHSPASACLMLSPMAASTLLAEIPQTNQSVVTADPIS